METYQNYRGLGISYQTFGGITSIDSCGFLMKRFIGYGESKGEILAKHWIDTYLD